MENDLSIEGQNIENNYVVIKGDGTVPERVAFAFAGFGCDPNSMGRCVMLRRYDKVAFRLDRSDIERFATKAEWMSSRKLTPETQTVHSLYLPMATREVFLKELIEGGELCKHCVEVLRDKNNA